MSWKKIKIGDCCEITSSKRIFYSDYVSEGVPFYRGKEIIEKSDGKPLSEPLYISEEKYNEIKKRFGVPSAGDLLLTSVGTIGIPYIVKNDDYFYFKDGNLTWFKDFNKNASSKFLYYWFLSPKGSAVLYNSTIGSSQKTLTISTLKELKFQCPSLDQQLRIIKILESYDSLIENNHKQIRLLEEAAQRLYKEWFVDLRFPGYENSIFENDIPCGWEFKKFSDLAEIVMGTSPKSEFYNTNHEGIPFHQGVGSYGKRFVNDDVYTTVAIKTATANSILISVRAPVGRVNITRNRIAIGRGLAAINCKNNCQNFLYYLIKAFFFKDDIVGNGSIFSSISKQELCDLKFLVPEERLIRQFNEKVKSIDNKIDILDKQILLLKEARDRLLPKLMNGEIEL